MHHFKLLLFIIVFSPYFLKSQTVTPDTVFLIDGSFITGDILNPGSENSIQVKNEQGAIIYIKNQRIDRLVIDPNKPILKPNTINSENTPFEYGKKAQVFDLNYRKRFISINPYWGIPAGKFSSNNFNTSSAGAAKPGLGLEAGYFKKIDEDLYWSLNFRYLRYGFNTSVLIPIIEQQTGFTPLSFSNAYYESLSFGGGLNWFYELNEKFRLAFTAAFFIQSVKMPEIKVLLNGATGSFPEQRGTGITPDFSTMFIYLNRFYFKLNFNTSRVTLYSSNSSGTTNYIQPVRAVGLSLGVFFPKIKATN
jgi:hypothetical protein